MLKGDHICLRTIRSRDLETFLDLYSDIEARGQHFPLRMFTETSVRERFNKDGHWSDESGSLLIVEKQTDRIIGLIVFFRPVFYYDCYELGYILFDKALRGKGVVTEAMRLLIKYLFDWQPIHRLQLQIEAENAPSVRVAEKCGFTFEGTMRKALASRGRYIDIGVYSLLREEWDSGITKP